MPLSQVQALMFGSLLEGLLLCWVCMRLARRYGPKLRDMLDDPRGTVLRPRKGWLIFLCRTSTLSPTGRGAGVRASTDA